MKCFWSILILRFYIIFASGLHHLMQKITHALRASPGCVLITVLPCTGYGVVWAAGTGSAEGKPPYLGTWLRLCCRAHLSPGLVLATNFSEMAILCCSYLWSSKISRDLSWRGSVWEKLLFKLLRATLWVRGALQNMKIPQDPAPRVSSWEIQSWGH